MNSKYKEINVIIGNNLRLKRIELGLSQEALAKELGISFQQVQKYEKGYNSIRAFHLVAFAEVLQVTPASLLTKNLIRHPSQDYQFDIATNHNMPSEREILEMVKVFKQVNSNTLRKCIVDFVRSAA